MTNAAPPGTDTARPQLRPERADDVAFLAELYASTRTEELALTGWDSAACAAFLDMQLSAQRQHYRTHYPDAQFNIVELDGVRIGRVYVHRTANEISLMDIAFLPEYRNRGLGSRVMQLIIDESRASGRPITLHVEINNPRAQRWYVRLGFSDVKTDGMHTLMRRDPR